MNVENNLVSFSFDESKSLLTAIWSEDCGNIVETEYEPHIREIHERVKKAEADKLIVDLSNCSLFQKADK